MKHLWLNCLLLLLTACGAPIPVASVETPTVALSTATSTIVPPLATPTVEPTQTTAPPPPTATLEPELTLCSPLEGIAIEELGQPDLLKTLFQMPRPGFDEGHHGVDFAYWSRGERTAMRGHPIQAALPGVVAGIVPDRQPYGYAVIVETRLDSFPQLALQLPAPAPTVVPNTSLSCPPGAPPEAVEGIPGTSERSLYLLYAHMHEPPLVQLNQEVSCGETLGVVGTTGRSVNDHLHLETRVGPAGATFPTMAHYDNAATETEMRTYCTWRVSGLFQLVDPMTLFSLQP
jgi:hypothetical protein